VTPAVGGDTPEGPATDSPRSDLTEPDIVERLRGLVIADEDGVIELQRQRQAAIAEIERLRAALAAPSVPPGPGAALIAAERQRQIEQEGWTPEHDEHHRHGELAEAAVCYAYASLGQWHRSIPNLWPWDASWWKPSADPCRNLAKAGALIAAEIDRLNPAAALDAGQAPPEPAADENGETCMTCSDDEDEPERCSSTPPRRLVVPADPVEPEAHEALPMSRAALAAYEAWCCRPGWPVDWEDVARAAREAPAERVVQQEADPAGRVTLNEEGIDLTIDGPSSVDHEPVPCFHVYAPKGMSRREVHAVLRAALAAAGERREPDLQAAEEAAVWSLYNDGRPSDKGVLCLSDGEMATAVQVAQSVTAAALTGDPWNGRCYHQISDPNTCTDEPCRSRRAPGERATDRPTDEQETS
jgi:hypothetical protein